MIHLLRLRRNQTVDAIKNRRKAPVIAPTLERVNDWRAHEPQVCVEPSRKPAHKLHTLTLGLARQECSLHAPVSAPGSAS